jgi:acyl carrier protein
MTKNKISRVDIETLVLETAKQVGEDSGIASLCAATLDTRLIGSKAEIDSMGLVALIGEIEQKLFERFGKQIVLADERALSERLSPFTRVETLVSYIDRISNE